MYLYVYTSICNSSCVCIFFKNEFILIVLIPVQHLRVLFSDSEKIHSQIVRNLTPVILDMFNRLLNWLMYLFRVPLRLPLPSTVLFSLPQPHFLGSLGMLPPPLGSPLSCTIPFPWIPVTPLPQMLTHKTLSASLLCFLGRWHLCVGRGREGRMGRKGKKPDYR